MTTLTVVAEDRVIIVDGEAVNADFIFPENLWAIQWDGTKGEAEWTDGPNTELTEEDEVASYLTQWSDTKDARKVIKDAAILAESQRVKPYTELRRAAYPPLREQLDMLYWDKVNNTILWQDMITATKELYPR